MTITKWRKQSSHLAPQDERKAGAETNSLRNSETPDLAKRSAPLAEREGYYASPFASLLHWHQRPRALWPTRARLLSFKRHHRSLRQHFELHLLDLVSVWSWMASRPSSVRLSAARDAPQRGVSWLFFGDAVGDVAMVQRG